MVVSCWATMNWPGLTRIPFKLSTTQIRAQLHVNTTIIRKIVSNWIITNRSPKDPRLNKIEVVGDAHLLKDPSLRSIWQTARTRRSLLDTENPNENHTSKNQQTNHAERTQTFEDYRNIPDPYASTGSPLFFTIATVAFSFLLNRKLSYMYRTDDKIAQSLDRAGKVTMCVGYDR